MFERGRWPEVAIDVDGVPWEISPCDDPQVRELMLSWHIEWDEQVRTTRADRAELASSGEGQPSALAVSVVALDGAPGPDLAAAIGACRARIDDLDGAGLEALIGATARLVNWASGIQARAIGLLATAPDPVAHFRGRDVTIFPALDEAVDVTACVLRLSKDSASGRVIAAYTMTRDLPDLLAALESGDIDTWRAQIILDALTGLAEHPDIARHVATEALAYARTGATAAALKNRIRKLLLAAAPDIVAARRKARLKKERGVRVFDEGDGLATLRWTDSAEVIHTGMAVIHGLARHASDPSADPPAQTPDTTANEPTGQPNTRHEPAEADRHDPAEEPCGVHEHRMWRPGSNAHTINERMADVTADLLNHAFHTLSLPKIQGRDPHLQVSIDLDTLLEITAHGGELTGYGPIPTELATAIAATATTLQLKVTDPDTGACLHLGKAHTYRPPQHLRDQVHAAQPRCRFPGCRRNALHCDVDHVVNHPDGPTCLCNLMPLCRRHHRAKTSRRWSAALHTPDDPTGAITWTSPHGRTHHDHPEHQPPPQQPPLRRGPPPF